MHGITCLDTFNDAFKWCSSVVSQSPSCGVAAPNVPGVVTQRLNLKEESQVASTPKMQLSTKVRHGLAQLFSFTRLLSKRRARVPGLWCPMVAAQECLLWMCTLYLKKAYLFLYLHWKTCKCKRSNMLHNHSDIPRHVYICIMNAHWQI